MKNIFAILLPATADNAIRGARLPVYMFMLIAIVSTLAALMLVWSLWTYRQTPRVTTSRGVSS